MLFKNARFPRVFLRSDYQCQNLIRREIPPYVPRSVPKFPYTADQVATFLTVYYAFNDSLLRSNLIAEEIYLIKRQFY